MKLNPNGRSPISLLIVGFIIVATHGSVAAQPASPTPIEVSIASATARQITVDNKVTGWAVFVSFTKEFDRAIDSTQAQNSGNYRIINANAGAQVAVDRAEFAPIKIGGSQERLQIVRLVLPSKDALNKDDIFYLFALNLSFKGAPPESVPMHQVKIQVDPADGKTVVVDEAGTDGTDAHREPKPAWGLKTSKGKDDSDLYGSYVLTKARGIATTGSGDLKVAVPFFSNFWGRTSKFSPLIDFKASSDAEADADSFKFALEWFLPLHVGEDPDARFPYTAIDLINSAKIEAPKNFNNINALWESRWLFPSSRFPGTGHKVRVFLDPFVGHEVGRNLKSPLKSAEGKGIARLMVGANLTIQIPVRNVAAIKAFEFTSSYIRRWPLTREVLVDKDAGGNAILLTLSKGPKDYSDSKFIIKVSDYFGPYVGYEWGRLPPSYNLVDHKWTFGLLFKSKLRVK